MRKKEQMKKAFTLVETLLYISLTSIILISITAFLGTLFSTRARNKAIAEVDGQAVQLMNYLTNTIKAADSVASPAAGNSDTQLILSFTDPGLDPTILDLNVDEIVVSEGGGADINLTSNAVIIDSLTFTNLSPTVDTETVRIEFTISYNNPDGRAEQDISKTFYGSATLR